MEIILTSLISYLIGSIPFGFILTKIFLKKDIRSIGSGNTGATNVLRTGNKSIGYSTLILDILKAVIPVLFTKFYIPDYIFISALSVLHLKLDLVFVGIYTPSGSPSQTLAILLPMVV